VFDTFCHSFDRPVPDLAVCTLGKAIPLDHHVYDELSKSWIQRNSKPQPFLNVTVQICAQYYSELGLDDYKVSSLAASIPALADTGCQSCLTGLKVVQRHGFREEQLIPVTMRMHGVNNDGIRILGALLLRISCIKSTDICD